MKGFQGWPGAELDSSHHLRAIRTDFTLGVDVLGTRPPTAFAPMDRTRLKKAGHYPVDRWPHLKDKRFIAFEELLIVLGTAGLTRIG
ncbi:hypothetical protein [Pseudomonas reactans]|uniref:hypothetical protein n=1 Tax=Pseudomonas reactans TaxID=117680 RepID=UPI0015A49055|nr:hypothetical protein [Pseudomonas reactans]NWA70205.1 hypothetical protein [Pseudomonas reactans]